MCSLQLEVKNKRISNNRDLSRFHHKLEEDSLFNGEGDEEEEE